jgi:predicted metalloendopeptidase
MTFRVALVVTVLAAATLLAGQSPGKSGLDLGNIDGAVRPQDDLFRYANGRWLATAEIPTDRVTLGTFAEMAERTDLHLRAIAEDAGGEPNCGAIGAATNAPRALRGDACFDWGAWASPLGFDRVWRVVPLQPSFFKGFAALVAETPLDILKNWLAARHLNSSAPYLSPAFVDVRFEMFGRILTGQELPRDRWRTGVSLVNTFLPDAIGRLYVERHFAPPAKARRTADGEPAQGVQTSDRRRHVARGSNQA